MQNLKLLKFSCQKVNFVGLVQVFKIFEGVFCAYNAVIACGLEDSRIKRFAKSSWSAIKTGPQVAYQMEDDIFKIIAYVNESNRYSRAFKFPVRFFPLSLFKTVEE